MSEVYTQQNPPDSASEGDRFVDSYDSQKIYVVTGDYDLSTTKASLSVPAASRPGSVALVFEAVTAGSEGNNIQVSITNGGSSGSASLATSGSGTRGSPYVYAFTVYDDSGSNDDLIALLSGDSYLTATGTDSSQGNCSDTAATALDNGVWDYLGAHVIAIRYAAELPELTGTSSTIHESIPSSVKNALAKKIALELANSNSGISVPMSIQQKWQRDWEEAMDTAKSNLAEGSYPNDFEPR